MTPLEYDAARIWHPYAALGRAPVLHAKSASGLEIELADGSRLVDAVSSWWCVAHGHNHPAIVEAIRRQSERMCHVMFGGFTHDPAVELAERLAAFAPRGLDRVFFADSGSISVEVAAKMAVQYQNALGHPERNRLVALKGGYHGDTSLCMALSDPDGMHTLFRGIMTRHFFADKPAIPLGGDWTPSAVDSLERVFDEHRGEIAALVCEPVFQAANAMNFYHEEYLRRMHELCDRHGVLLIFDEIAAGFHRTGPLWAHSRAGVEPDIMTVGKALTGGHMTLAATLASAKVADSRSTSSPQATTSRTQGASKESSRAGSNLSAPFPTCAACESSARSEWSKWRGCRRSRTSRASSASTEYGSVPSRTSSTRCLRSSPTKGPPTESALPWRTSHRALPARHPTQTSTNSPPEQGDRPEQMQHNRLKTTTVPSSITDNPLSFFHPPELCPASGRRHGRTPPTNRGRGWERQQTSYPFRPSEGMPRKLNRRARRDRPARH